MNYKLYKHPILNIINAVTRTNDDNSLTSIPFVEANTDYQAYLKWLEEGNEPLPPDEGV